MAEELAELRRCLESMPAMVVVRAADGSLEYMNRCALEFVGRTLSDLERSGWDSLIEPEDADTVLNERRRARETLTTGQASYRLRHVSGALRWVEERVQPLAETPGQVRLYSVVVDIEDRKSAEEALKQSEQELRLLVDAVPALIWRARTDDGYPDYLNKPLCEYMGKTIADFDRTVQVHPDDVDEILSAWDVARDAGRRYETTLRLLRADGNYRWHSVTGTPLRDENGTIVRWYGVNVDIDRIKRMEAVLSTMQARLSHASQLAAVAQLSASIAHEINQPLAAIVANAEACLQWLSGQSPNLERATLAAHRIVRDGHASTAVIERIRDLFRQSPEVREPLDVNSVVREVHGLLQLQAQLADVRLSLELATELPDIRADRVQLQQVLVNLLRNGLEALEEVSGRPRMLTVRTFAPSGDGDGEQSVLVEVSDSGQGVLQLETVFDPFITTKSHGMGLGLAICRTIVEAHGGKITARRNDGHGATFAFSLPTTP